MAQTSSFLRVEVKHRKTARRPALEPPPLFLPILKLMLRTGRWH